MARASDAAEGAALLNPLTRDVHELFLKPKAHELKLLAEGDGVASALSADDVLALVQSVSGAVHCLTAFHQAQDPLAQQWGPEARALAAQAFATWLSDSRLLVHAVAALRAAANTLLHRGGASSLGGPPSDPAVGRNAWHRLAHQLLVLLLTVATAARSFRAPVLIHHALTPAMTEALNAGLLEALSAVFERDPLADWSGALAASADFDKCCSSSGRGPTTESAPLPLAGTAAEVGSTYTMPSGCIHVGLTVGSRPQALDLAAPCRSAVRVLPAALCSPPRRRRLMAAQLRCAMRTPCPPQSPPILNSCHFLSFLPPGCALPLAAACPACSTSAG